MASSSLPLKKMGLGQWEAVFALHAEAVRPCEYCQGYTKLADVSALIGPVPAREVDGVTVKPGDEKAYVRTTELADGANVVPGDYLADTGDSRRRDVVAAVLDRTRSVWILYVRRAT